MKARATATQRILISLDPGRLLGAAGVGDTWDQVLGSLSAPSPRKACSDARQGAGLPGPWLFPARPDPPRSPDRGPDTESWLSPGEQCGGACGSACEPGGPAHSSGTPDLPLSSLGRSWPGSFRLFPTTGSHNSQ